MPYAFLNADGTIKVIVPKPTPFMKVGEGERIVGYNPPASDPELSLVTPNQPVPAEDMEVTFTTVHKAQSVYQEVQLRRKSALVQYYLDTAAQAKGYDNILAAISYAGSGHPVYDTEGQLFRAWRSACWDAAFAILDNVFDNNLPMPSDSDITASLPASPL